MRRHCASLLVVGALLAAGCEEGPTRPSESASLEFSGTAAASDSVLNHSFNSDRRGIAVVTLTWSNGAVDLDLIVTDASCADPRACVNRSISENVGTTTESVRFGVDNNEQILVWVRNFQGGAQPYSIAVTLD